MKASVSPVVLMTALLGLSFACAQDAIIQKDGQRREGQIVGVRNDAISLKVGPATTGIPLSNVASVTMNPPKEYQLALDAWSKGEIKETTEYLKVVVDNFLGLPTKWAMRAAALLGEVYVAGGKISDGEAAFGAFQKAYPDAGNLADVGLARLAIAKEDFSTAREKLAPIVEGANEVLLPETGQSAVLGQALFLMAEVQESSGDTSAALKNYLLATTIFREDKAVVAKAQERVKALEEKNVIVP